MRAVSCPGPGGHQLPSAAHRTGGGAVLDGQQNLRRAPPRDDRARGGPLRPHCLVPGLLHHREGPEGRAAAPGLHLQLPLRPGGPHEGEAGPMDQGLQVRGCGRPGCRGPAQGGHCQARGELKGRKLLNKCLLF